MEISKETLLHTLMIWNHPISKTTRHKALKHNYITSEGSISGIKFLSRYKRIKTSWFRDVYTLYDLKVVVDSEVQLHFINYELNVLDIEITESLPILEGIVKDKFVPLSDIFSKFTRVDINTKNNVIL